VKLGRAVGRQHEQRQAVAVGLDDGRERVGAGRAGGRAHQRWPPADPGEAEREKRRRALVDDGVEPEGRALADQALQGQHQRRAARAGRDDGVGDAGVHEGADQRLGGQAGGGAGAHDSAAAPGRTQSAARIARSLCSVSAHSSSGQESLTRPAPA
jgi:hypothetical protein